MARNGAGDEGGGRGGAGRRRRQRSRGGKGGKEEEEGEQAEEQQQQGGEEEQSDAKPSARYTPVTPLSLLPFFPPSLIPPLLPPHSHVLALPLSLARSPSLPPLPPPLARAQVQESFVVDRVLTRFSSLVRISLGEAGGKIVTANLTDGLSIDRSLPGPRHPQ